MDLSVFLTADAWISLITLIFLEIVLGVDNLVVISITTNRLPKEKQHIGRRLGLAGALIMRIIFLCFASWLTSMTDPLFTIDFGFYLHGFSLRDIILFVGGIYLIYKGIDELRGVLGLKELKEGNSGNGHVKHEIGLPRAVATVMVMDIVFSIDTVITAVGLVSQLIIMILAVIIAVIFMMVFINFISDFLNAHAEVKILALFFIAVIGVLLVLDAMGINSGIEVLDMSIEKLMVYFAMAFALVITFIQMRYNSNLKKYVTKLNGDSVGEAVSDQINESVHETADELPVAQKESEKKDIKEAAPPSELLDEPPSEHKDEPPSELTSDINDDVRDIVKNDT